MNCQLVRIDTRHVVPNGEEDALRLPIFHPSLPRLPDGLAWL